MADEEWFYLVVPCHFHPAEMVSNTSWHGTPEKALQACAKRNKRHAEFFASKFPGPYYRVVKSWARRIYLPGYEVSKLKTVEVAK